MIAYNNLGMNLLLIGDWTKAEAMINACLDLAVEKQSRSHVAGILIRSASLKSSAASSTKRKNLLEKAMSFAKERKNELVHGSINA